MQKNGKFRNITQPRRGSMRKSKVQLELKLAEDIRVNMNSFHCYIRSKRIHKENVGLAVNGVGELMTVDTNKAEVLSAFFTSLFFDRAFVLIKTWRRIISRG